MDTAYILSLLRKVRGKSPHWTACCPAHDDKNPSLSVTDAGDKILLYCHTGCSQGDVIAALGIKLSELFDGRQEDREITRRKARASYLTARMKAEGMTLIDIVGRLRAMEHMLPGHWLDQAIADGWERPGDYYG